MLYTVIGRDKATKEPRSLDIEAADDRAAAAEAVRRGLIFDSVSVKESNAVACHLLTVSKFLRGISVLIVLLSLVGFTFSGLLGSAGLNFAAMLYLFGMHFLGQAETIHLLDRVR